MHRSPNPWLREARRQAEKLRAHAALLSAASSTCIVIGMYSVVVAFVLTDELIPRIVSTAPILLAVGSSVVARRARGRANAYEREMDRLVSGFWEMKRWSRREHPHLRPLPGTESGRSKKVRTECRRAMT